MASIWPNGGVVVTINNRLGLYELRRSAKAAQISGDCPDCVIVPLGTVRRGVTHVPGIKR
jgi:hypothetical protein